MAGEQAPTRFGFFRSLVLPALWVFLIPALALAFFYHAESSYNADARQNMLADINANAQMTLQEKEEARQAVAQVPFSEMIRHPQFAAQVDETVLFHMRFFRWMIWLSLGCVISGVAVFLLAGVCVLLSLRSQEAQYWSLAAGWHVLRLYGALQTVAQGVLVVSLSFWVTALWFERYYPKLIFIAGALALVAVALVVKAIFSRVSSDFAVSGVVIDPAQSPQLWQRLMNLCQQADTAPPDQIVAGIDDNFFVTEHPVIVDGTTYTGRTLFVSLALLKQLDGAEADAVMAHELAHFSGNDTTYSKRISPLLIRYGNFLQAMHEGAITIPIYYFMLCFRGLFELSLGKLSREREYRADGIAAKIVSPQHVAGALLRIAAYSKYRHTIESSLFDKEEQLESANIGQQVETGFATYARGFADNKEWEEFSTAHPFDTHPRLVDRLKSVGVELTPTAAASLLGSEGNGDWYRLLTGAEELERQQWTAYEEQFRAYHRQMLAYRYLPSTEEEEQLVLEFFPEQRYVGGAGELVINYTGMQFAGWSDPIAFEHIKSMSINDGVLQIVDSRPKTKGRNLKLGKFGKNYQPLLDVINAYYVRDQAARNYQESKAAQLASEAAPATT